MASKFSPSRLQHIKKLLNEGAELTEGQRGYLICLIDKEAESRQLDNSLSEFHKWIRLGDMLLTKVEKELTDLRALTREGGDTISKAAVLDILAKLYMNTPKSEQNVGANWALDKVAEEIEKLYAI